MNTPHLTPVPTDALAPDDAVLAPEEARVQEDPVLPASVEPGESAPAAPLPAEVAEMAEPLPGADMSAPAAPVPPLSSLRAAEDAAAFVAQIFAQVAAPAVEDQAAAAAQAAPAEAQPELPPVPAGWPQATDEQDLPLAGQQLLVLGLGASGLAMARWCARCGAQVTV
ncbi:MAG: UDP-N-acetylmuramoyl-L-alanine--D-glutamate ligase, partial [Comamonas sp.]